MILLVASQPQERKALAHLISASGYEVVPMSCGDEVVATLRFRNSNLVILDCAHGDSFRLLSEIRAEHQIRATPIVMFGEDSNDLKERALLRGADGYIPKGSLDWADLLQEINRLAGPPEVPESA